MLPIRYPRRSILPFILLIFLASTLVYMQPFQEIESNQNENKTNESKNIERPYSSNSTMDEQSYSGNNINLASNDVSGKTFEGETVGIDYASFNRTVKSLDYGYTDEFTRQQTWGTSGGILYNSLAIATDSQGNVYVTENTGDKVLKYDTNGTFLFSFAEGDFAYPQNIEVDENDTIYLVDGNGNLNKYTTEGELIESYSGMWAAHDLTIDNSNGDIYIVNFGNDLVYVYNKTVDLIDSWSTGNQPEAISMDSNGDLFVSITGDVVYKYNQTGTLLTSWGSGGTGDGEFNGPYGLEVDYNDDVFVTDRSNYRVQKFNNTGSFLTKWGSSGTGDGEFDLLEEITVDDLGNVYVLDNRQDRVQKFNGTGTFLTKWGSFFTEDDHVNLPWYSATDSDGNYYVTDEDQDMIRKFDNDGNFLIEWGSYGTGNSEFDNPRGIAIDYLDNIYVVDNGNDRVQIFDSSGNYLSKFGSSGSGDGDLNNAYGIAIDSLRNVYVADSGNARVEKFNYAGSFLLTWSTSSTTYSLTVDNNDLIYTVDTTALSITKYDALGNELLQWGSNYGVTIKPSNAVVDSGGNIFVADPGSNTVYSFTPLGGIYQTFNDLVDPTDMQFDSLGNLYIVDYGNNSIEKYDSDGNFVLQWGSSGSGDGQFNGPYAIDINSTDYIYVTDSGNARVQVFDTSGNFLDKFGSSGTGDGQFNTPKGIAIDPIDDDVYVSDSFNSRLQKFNTTNDFQEVIGSIGNGDGQFVLSGGLSFNSSGFYFAADVFNDRIEIFNSTDDYVGEFNNRDTGDTTYLTSTAINSDGNIIVSQTDTGYLDIYNSTGSILETLGFSETDDGYFKTPYGIAADSSNYIIVADSGNARIQKFDSFGNFVISWGSSGDGDNQFSNPKGVSTFSTDIFVSDTNNYRIVKYGFTIENIDSTGQNLPIAPDNSDFIITSTSGNNLIENIALGFTFYDTIQPNNLGIIFSWYIYNSTDKITIFEDSYLILTFDSTAFYFSDELRADVEFKYTSTTGFVVNITSFDTGLNTFITTNSSQIPFVSFDLSEIRIDYIWATSQQQSANLRSTYRYSESVGSKTHSIDLDVYEYKVPLKIYAPLSWNLTNTIPTTKFKWNVNGYWSINNTLPTTYSFKFISGSGYGVDYAHQDFIVALKDTTSEYFQNPGFEYYWRTDWSERSGYEFEDISLNSSIVFDDIFSLRLDSNSSQNILDYKTSPGSGRQDIGMKFLYVSFNYYLEELDSANFSYYKSQSSEWVDIPITGELYRWNQFYAYIELDPNADGSDFLIETKNTILFLDSFYFGETSANEKTVNYNEYEFSATFILFDGYKNPNIPYREVVGSIRERATSDNIYNKTLITDINGYASYTYKKELPMAEYDNRWVSYESWFGEFLYDKYTEGDSADYFSEACASPVSESVSNPLGLSTKYSFQTDFQSACWYDYSTLSRSETNYIDMSNKYLTFKIKINTTDGWDTTRDNYDSSIVLYDKTAGLNYIEIHWFDYYPITTLTKTTEVVVDPVEYSAIGSGGFNRSEVKSINLRFRNTTDTSKLQIKIDEWKYIQFQSKFFTPIPSGYFPYSYETNYDEPNYWDFSENRAETDSTPSLNYEYGYANTTISGWSFIWDTGYSQSIDQFYDSIITRIRTNDTNLQLVMYAYTSSGNYRLYTIEITGTDWRTYQFNYLTYWTVETGSFASTDLTRIAIAITDKAEVQIDFIIPVHKGNYHGHSWEFNTPGDVEIFTNTVGGSLISQEVKNGKFYGTTDGGGYQGIESDQYAIDHTLSTDYNVLVSIYINASTRIRFYFFRVDSEIWNAVWYDLTPGLNLVEMNYYLESSGIGFMMDTGVAAEFQIDYVRFYQTSLNNIDETTTEFAMNSFNNTNTYRYEYDTVLGYVSDLSSIPKNLSLGSHNLLYTQVSDTSINDLFLQTPSIWSYYPYIQNSTINANMYLRFQDGLGRFIPFGSFTSYYRFDTDPYTALGENLIPFEDTSVTVDLYINDSLGNELFNSAVAYSNFYTVTIDAHEVLFTNQVNQSLLVQLKLPALSWSEAVGYWVGIGAFRTINFYNGTYDMRVLAEDGSTVLKTTTLVVNQDVPVSLGEEDDLILYDYNWDVIGGNISVTVITNYGDAIIEIWDDETYVGDFNETDVITWESLASGNSSQVYLYVKKNVTKYAAEEQQIIFRAFNYFLSTTDFDSLITDVGFIETVSYVNVTVETNQDYSTIYIWHDGVLHSIDSALFYTITKSTTAGSHNITIAVQWVNSTGYQFVNWYILDYWVASYYFASLDVIPNSDGLKLVSNQINFLSFNVYVDGELVSPVIPDPFVEQKTNEINQSLISDGRLWIRNTRYNLSLEIRDKWDMLIYTSYIDISSFDYRVIELPLVYLQITSTRTSNAEIQMYRWNATTEAYELGPLIAVPANSTINPVWVIGGLYKVRVWDIETKIEVINEQKVATPIYTESEYIGQGYGINVGDRLYYDNGTESDFITTPWNTLSLTPQYFNYGAGASGRGESTTVGGSVTSWIDQTISWIQDNPFLAALITFGIFVLMWLFFYVRNKVRKEFTSVPTTKEDLTKVSEKLSTGLPNVSQRTEVIERLVPVSKRGNMEPQRRKQSVITPISARNKSQRRNQLTSVVERRSLEIERSKKKR